MNNNNEMKPTIVGAQPQKEREYQPGERTVEVSRPIGIEIMLKKAKVDKKFKKMLLKNRSDAAFKIKLVLEESEIEILNCVPEEQLSEMIDNMHVEKNQRPAFKKYVAAAMVAAMGLTPVLLQGCAKKNSMPLAAENNTSTPTMANSETSTMSVTDTPTDTYTASATPTDTHTVTPVGTTVFTPTYTFTQIFTPAASGTFTATPQYTDTPTATYTSTYTQTPSGTPTGVGITVTPTPTKTNTP